MIFFISELSILVGKQDALTSSDQKSTGSGGNLCSAQSRNSRASLLDTDEV